VEGDITYEEAVAAVHTCMDRFNESLPDLPEGTGTLVLRVEISPSGVVTEVNFLTDTLVARPWDVTENDEGTARARIQVFPHFLACVGRCCLWIVDSWVGWCGTRIGTAGVLCDAMP
jgi:hypothetical protein